MLLEAEGQPVAAVAGRFKTGLEARGGLCRALLERGAVRRPGRGRSRLRLDRVAGDKGYTGGRISDYPLRRGSGR